MGTKRILNLILKDAGHQCNDRKNKNEHKENVLLLELDSFELHFQLCELI